MRKKEEIMELFKKIKECIEYNKQINIVEILFKYIL